MLESRTECGSSPPPFRSVGLNARSGGRTWVQSRGRRVFDITVGRATVLNGINVVTKMAEMAVKLERLDGTSVSSASWFSKAPADAVREFLQSR